MTNFFADQRAREAEQRATEQAARAAQEQAGRVNRGGYRGRHYGGSESMEPTAEELEAMQRMDIDSPQQQEDTPMGGDPSEDASLPLFFECTGCSMRRARARDTAPGASFCVWCDADTVNNDLRSELKWCIHSSGHETTRVNFNHAQVGTERKDFCYSCTPLAGGIDPRYFDCITCGFSRDTK